MCIVSLRSDILKQLDLGGSSPGGRLGRCGKKEEGENCTHEVRTVLTDTNPHPSGLEKGSDSTSYSHTVRGVGGGVRLALWAHYYDDLLLLVIMLLADMSGPVTLPDSTVLPPRPLSLERWLHHSAGPVHCTVCSRFKAAHTPRQRSRPRVRLLLWRGPAPASQPPPTPRHNIQVIWSLESVNPPHCGGFLLCPPTFAGTFLRKHTESARSPVLALVLYVAVWETIDVQFRGCALVCA